MTAVKHKARYTPGREKGKKMAWRERDRGDLTSLYSSLCADRTEAYLQVIKEDTSNDLLDVQGEQRILDQDDFARLWVGHQ